MPDPLAGLDGADASADAPVTFTAADIEKIKAEFQGQLDTRVAGFQRLLSERDVKLDALNSELEELKTSGLSEDEREQLAQDALRRENEELRSKLELKDLAGQFGDEMPFYERLLAGDSAEAQLMVLRELRNPQPAPAQQPEPEAEAEIPDTDPNRSGRVRVDGAVLPDGSRMNEAQADRILSAVTSPMARFTQRNVAQND